MMNEEEFGRFLKRGGRSQSVLERIINHIRTFEQYLQDVRNTTLDDACPEDLEAFIEWLETRENGRGRSKGKKSARTLLWAICYYYEYTSNETMRHLAAVLREERIERKPFSLRDFRGINTEHTERLADLGIKNVNQLLSMGKTPLNRQNLSEKSGVPIESILELVKLSDLSRIPGVKGIRARLYYDAGVDTVEKLAKWDPEALRTMLIEFVEKTGFDGIAPLPAEAAFTVKTANGLPKIVEYEYSSSNKAKMEAHHGG